MIKLLLIWVIAGVLVGYLKVRQSQQLGFPPLAAIFLPVRTSWQ